MVRIVLILNNRATMHNNLKNKGKSNFDIQEIVPRVEKQRKKERLKVFIILNYKAIMPNSLKKKKAKKIIRKTLPRS